MRFLKCPLVHLPDTYARCSLHLPAVVQHMSRWPSSPARERSCASVAHTAINNQSSATTNNQSPSTTNNQSPAATNNQSPGCETSQGHTPATDYHSSTGVQTEGKSQHRYHCSTGNVGHLRSVASVNPCLVQHAAPHGRCPEFAHSLWYPSVVCSRRFLGPASNVSFTPVVLGPASNVSFTPVVLGPASNVSFTPVVLGPASNVSFTPVVLGPASNVSFTPVVLGPASNVSFTPVVLGPASNVSFTPVVLGPASNVSFTPVVLGPASNVSFTPVVLGWSTNSSASCSPSVRWYRGHTRSQALQSSGTGSLDVDEGTGNIVDEAAIDSGSDTDMSFQLSAVRHESSQPGEDMDLAAWQDAEEITSTHGRRRQLIPRKPADAMTLPELSQKSLNIVPYVKRSVTLQNLVRLGVNLSKIQKMPGVAEYLIKADFDGHIVPQLRFLALVGIKANMVGHIYTANPLLFLESVEDLELRVGYLVHKNFGLREVASMVTKDPRVLLMDPIMLDEKLAFLQDLFHLTDHQVREVVKIYPLLLPVKNQMLTNMKFHLQEFVGFSNTQVQELLLKCPRVFFCDKEKLVQRFDYLHNHMLISQQQMLAWPQILHTRMFVFKTRHLFLLHQGRAQYDPCRENYVSLQALATTSEEEFCRTVAKCHLQEFYDFCKTL